MSIVIRFISHCFRGFGPVYGDTKAQAAFDFIQAMNAWFTLNENFLFNDNFGD